MGEHEDVPVLSEDIAVRLDHRVTRPLPTSAPNRLPQRWAETAITSQMRPDQRSGFRPTRSHDL